MKAFSVHGLFWACFAASAGATEWSDVVERIEHLSPIMPEGVAITVGKSSRMYAYSRGETDTTTRMGIASATKWIAGAAILGVVSEGKLGLDDLVSEHLPYWSTDERDVRSNITLRHLLAFNDGYTGGYSCSGLNTAECARKTHEDLSHSGNAPGTYFDYNSLHLLFAGAMAESATAETMVELVDRFVIDRYKMNSTTWNSGTLPSLSGGITSNADDYEKFLQALLTYDVIPEQLVNEMDKDQYPYAKFQGYAVLMGHYGLANWFECIGRGFNSPLPDKCIENTIHTSPGARGYYPLIDRRLSYYINIAYSGASVIGPAISAILRLYIKPLVDAVVTGEEEFSLQASRDLTIDSATVAAVEELKRKCELEQMSEKQAFDTLSSILGWDFRA